MTFKLSKTSLALGLILLLGLAFRLVNIGFGLPGMYDPDEPLFVLKAYKLLDDGTLNPGWFGHPGTTTIYLMAIVDVLVFLSGLATQRFGDLQQFAAAVYADPGIIFIPSRLAMVLIALGTIALTYLIGRRLFGTATGLAAATLLALNGLHIAWSQVIRTDIHASLFMLASMLFAIRGAEGGRNRDFILAGMFVGLAMATKWPGGVVIVSVLGAAAYHAGARKDYSAAARPALLALATALVGLFLGSPYVFLDWQTVIANVSGEVASGHLGHTGTGFLPNLWWYLHTQVAATMGWLGLGLAVAGMILIALNPLARATLLPTMLLFLVMISAQEQIWSRWLTPALPFLCIAAASAVVLVAERAAARLPGLRRDVVIAGVAAAAMLPSLAGAIAGMRERATDTRDLASAWAMANVPAGSRIVVEHLALDLLPQRWDIRFPVGASGCIDGREALKGGVRYEDIQKARQGSPIVDLGNVDPARLSTCQADYAILTYYDLYVAEAESFPTEMKTYEQLIGSGRTVALFRPSPGRSGGPVTRIVALAPQGERNPEASKNP